MENVLVGAEDLQHQPLSSQWTKYFELFLSCPWNLMLSVGCALCERMTVLVMVA